MRALARDSIFRPLDPSGIVTWFCSICQTVPAEAPPASETVPLAGQQSRSNVRVRHA